MKLNGTWQRALIGLLVILMAVPVGFRTEQHPGVPAGGTRPDAGADRPVSRFAPGADPHGGHVPAGGRPGGPVGPGQRASAAEARNDALDRQNWDPSVKALTPFPDVLAMMSEKLDWTQQVGDAFLAQEQDVMATIQDLRAKAYEAGNLRTTEQQNVRREADIIVVEPANPRVVLCARLQPDGGLRPMAGTRPIPLMSSMLILPSRRSDRHGRYPVRRRCRGGRCLEPRVGALGLGSPSRLRQREPHRQHQQDDRDPHAADPDDHLAA